MHIFENDFNLNYFYRIERQPKSCVDLFPSAENRITQIVKKERLLDDFIIIKINIYFSVSFRQHSVRIYIEIQTYL